MSQIPEVVECLRDTGSDSSIVKVVATSLDHLARAIDQLSLHGVPDTSIVRPNPLKRHTVPRETVQRVREASG